jgi:hypothetical protein
MQKPLPTGVITAIHQIVVEAEANNEILDAFAVAAKIKRSFPDQDLPEGELIAMMLRSGLQAMELAPTSLLIEFILPLGAPAEDELTAEASVS